MKYRKFGKLSWEGPALGFGAMRLPVIGDKKADIDEAEARRMIGYAIEHGVNYIDTGYRYHEGQSEFAIGRILKDGYRDKVKLATKMPSFAIQSYHDFDRYLHEQLGRLQTDRIDFYLLHGLNRNFWPKLRDTGVLRWAERAMADGLIGHLGFSFHDDFPTLKEIVDAYDNWTMCQLQYNYLDTDYQAGTVGVRYAADKGLAVVVMEPLRGGRLTKRPPPQVAEILAKSPKLRTGPEWGLQWVWDHQEVSVVLSGMSTLDQVVENVALAERSDDNTLSADELQLIDKVREIYQRKSPIPCTKCQYCMPCPNGVVIPRILEFYNEAIMYDDIRKPRQRYQGRVGLKAEQRGDRCIECGQCEPLCPQNIPITEWLKKTHELLNS
jgi:predicted aldo/keto reductase-like oxidoreductase